MRRILFVALAVLAASGICELRNLDDVFEVDIRDPKKYLSSCLRKANPSDPNSKPIYDPNAHREDCTHILNSIWFYVNRILTVTNNRLMPESYERNLDVRKLLYSFFGIREHLNSGYAGSYEPPPASLYGQKLEHVRGEP